MSRLTHIAHQAVVTAELAGGALRRRLGGRVEPAPDREAFEARCRRWLADLPDGAVASAEVVEVPAKRPPWLDTGLDLAAGDIVSWFAAGRVYLARALDIWVGPQFQLWARVGADGEVFRGTRETHSFTAAADGRLYLASYFPGEWASREGRLGTDPKAYRSVSGGMRVLLLRWPAGTDPAAALPALAERENAPAQLTDEVARLGAKARTPADWRYLWFLGDSEIYARDAPGEALACRTCADVGILQHDVDLPLTPDTWLHWAWYLETLPSRLAEDTLPTHDYLSIAVAFDNGQDITWHWSARLPAETVYRCPLPTWRARETHIVVGCGEAGLGAWRSHARNVHADCVRALGAPAERITQVWLIANSLFQRRPGVCRYRDIRLVQGERRIDIA